MGENKHIEEIHAFTKKYVKEISTESPSIDFTSNLMGKINQLQAVEAKTIYKPLISKKGWLLVFVILLGIILIPFKSSKEEGLFTLPEFNLSFLEKINFSGVFENINISNSTVYLAITFLALVFIQIFYLKGHFEKQIKL